MQNLLEGTASLGMRRARQGQMMGQVEELSRAVANFEGYTVYVRYS